MSRSVFRRSIDISFLESLHEVLNLVLNDFDQTSHIDPATIDEVEEVRDTLGEILSDTEEDC